MQEKEEITDDWNCPMNGLFLVGTFCGRKQRSDLCMPRIHSFYWCCRLYYITVVSSAVTSACPESRHSIGAAGCITLL